MTDDAIQDDFSEDLDYKAGFKDGAYYTSWSSFLRGLLVGIGLMFSGLAINQHAFHTVKHTGAVYVAAHDPKLGYVLQHPDGRAFLMNLDEPIVFTAGTVIKDIAYTDRGWSKRHVESVIVK
jgi:hypothetical protein